VPDATNWKESPKEEVATAPQNVTPITEEQRKMLLGIANSKGKPKENVNAYILEKYDINSTTKIPVFLFDEICEYYKAMPDVPAGY
jgi:hypothetical protein